MGLIIPGSWVRAPPAPPAEDKAEQSTAALYRLTQVKAAVADGCAIYVGEGEKDVHALESIGLIATTAPQGAGQWDLVDAPLAGATVVVTDNDKAGMRHAAQVQASLAGL